jgi:hypothetical protein
MKICSVYEVLQNFAKRFKMKFCLNLFRAILQNFAKFCGTGEKLRLVSCFAEMGEPNVVATLVLMLIRRTPRRRLSEPVVTDMFTNCELS